MPDRLRILRDALLLTGATVIVIVAASALAARPVSLYWLVRASPFILLASLIASFALARLFGDLAQARAVVGEIEPTLTDMPMDEARRRVAETLGEAGVQRSFDRAPDDMDAIALAHESIVRFAHDWGSLRSRALDLEIDLGPVAERLRAARPPAPGETPVEIGRAGGRALLIDVATGAVVLVDRRADGAQPVVPTLHHAVVYASLLPGSRAEPAQRLLEQPPG